jgi:hypothetical protein
LIGLGGDKLGERHRPASVARERRLRVAGGGAGLPAFVALCGFEKLANERVVE